MLLDKLAIFEDKLALSTLAVATTLGTNSYDTIAAGVSNAVGPAGAIGGGYATVAGSATQAPTTAGQLLHDIGRGRPVFFLGQIGDSGTTGVGATSGGAATLVEDIVEADNGALTTNLNVIQSTPSLALAVVAQLGYRLPFKALPTKIQRRFLGTRHTVGTAVYTGGTISEALVLGTDDHADVIGGMAQQP